MPPRPEAHESADQRERIFPHQSADAIVRIEDVPGVTPHPRKPARPHGAEPHARDDVEHVVAHVEADQRAVAELEYRARLFLVRAENQLLADAEERVPAEE